MDSSTQSTKVLLCRADSGDVVAQGSAPHPPGIECHPRHWWTALQEAGNGLLGQAAAIAISGQQHGMVVLDADDEVIRPALLWNDLRSAPQAAALVGRVRRAPLVGGADRQRARRVVHRDEAALARRARTGQPPEWPRPPARRYAGEPQPELRMRYAALRNATVGWS